MNMLLMSLILSVPTVLLWMYVNKRKISKLKSRGLKDTDEQIRVYKDEIQGIPGFVGG